MYASLPNKKYEQLIQVIDKMRSSRKKSFAKKARHINPNCLIQNELRKKLIKIKPNNMKPIEDNITGVDYKFGKTKIDQKFSFGDLGENAIIIRTKKKITKRIGLTLIINKEQKLNYSKQENLLNLLKNWGIVQKILLKNY